jgi:lipopolysaccharide biosynthesis protein
MSELGESSANAGPGAQSLGYRLLRFGFRLLPLGVVARNRLRKIFHDRFGAMAAPDPRPLAELRMHRRARERADEPAIGHVPYRREDLPSPLPATLVAFYLPQFHPIAENDEWWGKGFTEWRNVQRALPQFDGHAQPRLPADLGCYDLRCRETMHEQVRLAREYGIGAFCFYFYWFSGRTLLEQPLQMWLDDPTLDLPFCLCWANESWSRRWDGRSDEVLIAQAHSPEDDLAYIAHVAPYLRDPRYLRIEGKPLLLVYRPNLLPDARQTADRWRGWCRRNGVGEIHIAYVQGFECPDPNDIGFDSAVEFPPNLANPADITDQHRRLNPSYAGQILDWRELAEDYRQRGMPAYSLFPGVNCGWDNEPRRPGRGRTFLHASPRGYRDWLSTTVSTRLAGVQPSRRLVFINAWNEWAEGAVLEPDRRLGHAWLQATRDALRLAGPLADQAGRGPGKRACVVVHAWHADVLGEILDALRDSGLAMRLVVTTTCEKRDEVQSILSARGLDAELDVFENRGRDVLPFLKTASRLLDEGEDVVLKLHTKRSQHRDDGAAWRRELLARLVGGGRAPGIVRAFENQPTLGMVGPEGHILPIRKFVGGNRELLDYLPQRLGVSRECVRDGTFVAGNMFWVRLEALRPVLDASLDCWEFEPESGQVDGTCAHALERMMACCVREGSYGVASASEVTGQAQAGPAGAYAYARED